MSVVVAEVTRNEGKSFMRRSQFERMDEPWWGSKNTARKQKRGSQDDGMESFAVGLNLNVPGEVSLV